MWRALHGEEIRGFKILLRQKRMPDRRVKVDAYPVRKEGDVMGAMVRSRLFSGIE
ncbi:MAG: hypothetical protein NVS9B15_06700 [Acidobacteriaceae bacterium]